MTALLHTVLYVHTQEMAVLCVDGMTSWFVRCPWCCSVFSSFSFLSRVILFLPPSWLVGSMLRVVRHCLAPSYVALFLCIVPTFPGNPPPYTFSCCSAHVENLHNLYHIVGNDTKTHKHTHTHGGNYVRNTKLLRRESTSD